MNSRILFCTSLFLSSIASAQHLNLATTPWPPFTGEKDQPRMVVELVEEALRRADTTITVTVVPESTLTTKLKEKVFDGSPAMWRDKDREKFLEYSTPLLENRLVLVGKKGTDVSAKSLSELKGKRVGVIEGYAYGEEVAQAKGVTFVRGFNHQVNMEKMLKGELDFILVEDLLMEHMLAYQGEATKSKLQIGRHPLVVRSLHFTLRKDIPEAAEIMKKFNIKLHSMLADGTYNRILELNWISADVDGDGKMELVSRSKHLGKAPPATSYSIFSSDQEQPLVNQQRYFIDGQTYSSWDSVPAQYRADELNRREQSKPLLQFKL